MIWGGEKRSSKSFLDSVPVQFAVLPPEERTRNCFLSRYRGSGFSLPTPTPKSFFTMSCLIRMNLSQGPPVSKTGNHRMPSSPKRALEAGQPQTRWPPLTPWRAALKGSIHLWGLKAPLSPAGAGVGSGGSALRRKECVWRNCPQGSRLQVPSRFPSGPLHDPISFPH